MKSVLKAGAFVLGAAALASGQAQAPYDAQDLVWFKGAPQLLGARELPVPFDPPVPGTPSADDAQRRKVYRTLADLETILNKTSIHGLLTQVTIGQSQPSQGGAIPARNIIAVDVSDAGSARRDGTLKGSVLLLSSLHAREWVAIEALVRRLEAFQTVGLGSFEEAYDKMVARTALGPRDAYYVENLRIRFIPLLNRGALEVSHNHPTSCHMITLTSGSASEGLVLGNLRDGRLRRKNLRGTDGVTVTNQAIPNAARVDDPDALFGIDVNRNLTQTTNASLNPEASNFRGAGPLYPTEPEAVALRSAAQALFGPANRRTGAAALDIHSPLTEVSFASPGGADATMYRKFADVVSAAAYARVATADANTKGTTEDLLRNTFQVPSVTVELPPEAAILSLFGMVLTPGGSPAGPPTTVGNRLIQSGSQVDLQFMTSVGGVGAATPMVARAIDAGLDWAAGQPYVQRVAIVQSQDGNDSFSFTKADPLAPDEVLYYQEWRTTNPVDPWALRTLVPVNPAVVGPRWINATATATLVVTCSKPMRTAATASRRPTKVAVQVGANLPDLDITTSAAWEATAVFQDDGSAIKVGGARYEYDTCVVTFNPLAFNFVTARDGRLVFADTDQVVFALDSDPATPSELTNGAFARHDPGEDTNHRGFSIDTVPPNLVKLTAR